MADIGDKGHMSPLLEKVLTQKQHNRTSAQSLYWAAVNLLLSLAMYFELKFSPVAEYFSLSHPVVWYAELFLTAVFSLNTITDFIQYLYPLVSTKTIPLTPKQSKLMGVHPGERSFTASPGSSNTPSSKSVVRSTSIGHKASYSNLSAAYSPQSRTPSPVKSGSFTSMSQTSFGASPGGSFLSNSRPGSNLSGSTSMLSPMDTLNDTSGLRARNSPYRQSPVSSDTFITDQRLLQDFLREEEDKDEKRQASESSSGASISYWAINRSATDYAPVLRKYQYQLACRNPQSTRTHTDDDPDHPAKYSSSQVWSKLDIIEVQRDRWIENIRYWLNQTIFVRLVQQIDIVNNSLRRIGCSDLLIGEVSISTLKQLAVTKSQHVPSLNSIIPYLELTSHQEYLVSRIRDLGKGGCMSDYDWNRGAKFKGKSWADHLPTDASIVAHAFCTYFDARLPVNPRFTDGRTFTTVHFIKTPEKPAPSKGCLCLYQSRINPPHFNVVIGEDLWEIPKGWNNFFYALIVFLHHIKNKEHGMLGPIQLGLSGVNILWVLED